MAPFYSRYVPNSTAVSSDPVNQDLSLASWKRKWEDEPKDSRQDIKKSKKTSRKQQRDVPNRLTTNGDFVHKNKVSSASSTTVSKEISIRVESLTRSPEAGNGDHGVHNSKGQPLRKERRDRNQRLVQHEVGNPNILETNQGSRRNGLDIGDGAKAETGKEKRKKRKKTSDLAEAVSEDADTSGILQDHHTGIRSKFEKSKRKIADNEPGSEQGTEQKENEPSPPEELHGLEPLPQPPPVPKSDEIPTFSTLPPWLANPLRVDSAQASGFTTLGLDPVVLENVTKQRLENAFPVQSVVIPLLIDGPQRHPGDVCISAATGSGKTLAYLLPMIQHLTKLATTKLRGLIVVPTRELVKQARESCEMCASGTRIRIATALGSRTLHDEQEALVETYEVYDPDEYQKQLNAPVEWRNINLGGLLSELDDEKEAPADFVTKYRSKVDVLICTPGRLVDHITSTKGFTLNDIEWLVIDEADRLLNESFQEWTDVVVPTLQSRTAHTLQDNILRHMKLEIPDRIVQKVVLSATMTQDVSRLNYLKLRNPKLVVVGNANNTTETEVIDGSALEPQLDDGGAFNLPSTLIEYAVPAGDGAEKPLFLLELLRTKVNVFDLKDPGEIKSTNIEDDDASTSTSDSSESESESTISSSHSSSRSWIPRSHKLTRSSPDQPTESLDNNTALIFTRSTESATRLSRLLSLLSTPISSLTTTLTKSSTSSSTRKALTNFRQNKIRIIIATDRASRGLDLPNLGHVISYDVPTSMTTYVHRVGRTARAGKMGTAWTLLAHREARWFWNEIGKGIGEVGRIVRNGKVQRLNLDLNIGNDGGGGTRGRYEKALKTLGEEVVGGGGGIGAK
jgi:ATP-dependent RNA helicase DDX51/DBP6